MSTTGESTFSTGLRGAPTTGFATLIAKPTTSNTPGRPPATRQGADDPRVTRFGRPLRLHVKPGITGPWQVTGHDPIFLSLALRVMPALAGERSVC